MIFRWILDSSRLPTLTRSANCGDVQHSRKLLLFKLRQGSGDRTLEFQGKFERSHSIRLDPSTALQDDSATRNRAVA
jgi:hypothetical protein